MLYKFYTHAEDNNNLHFDNNLVTFKSLRFINYFCLQKKKKPQHILCIAFCSRDFIKYYTRK